MSGKSCLVTHCPRIMGTGRVGGGGYRDKQRMSGETLLFVFPTLMHSLVNLKVFCCLVSFNLTTKSSGVV